MMLLLPLLLLSLGMMACLGLFLSLKAELHARARRSEERIESMLVRLQHAETPAGSPEPVPQVPLAAAALALAPHPAPDVMPQVVYVPLRSGINVNRRTEALRLLRRGGDVSHVAATLGIPRSEIELLVRVQELVAHRAAETWAEATPPQVAQAAGKTV